MNALSVEEAVSDFNQPSASAGPAPDGKARSFPSDHDLDPDNRDAVSAREAVESMRNRESQKLWSRPGLTSFARGFADFSNALDRYREIRMSPCAPKMSEKSGEPAIIESRIVAMTRHGEIPFLSSDIDLSANALESDADQPFVGIAHPR